jgi:hypothetical protein
MFTRRQDVRSCPVRTAIVVVLSVEQGKTVPVADRAETMRQRCNQQDASRGTLMVCQQKADLIV